MIRDVVAVQEPSGYLNAYYNGDRKRLRMPYDIQTTGHRNFIASVTCCGGAITYYRATGDPTLLNAGDFVL